MIQVRREAISLVVPQYAFLTQNVFIFKQRKHKPTKRQFTKYNVFSLINSIFKGFFFVKRFRSIIRVAILHVPHIGFLCYT